MSLNLMTINKFLFLSVLILPTFLLHAYAYNAETITANTNKDTFQLGEKVIINGNVSNIINDNPVTIIVRNPVGNVYEIGQVDLIKNFFIHDFIINDNSLIGNYTINVKYATQFTQLHFRVNSGVVTTIPVLDSEIKVITNANLIKYGTASISDKTITIPIDTTKIETSVEQQYQVPKKIIDTPSGEINLAIDGTNASCVQSETDTFRILDCKVPPGSKEIQLSGSVVIPEFGLWTGFAMFVSIFIMIFSFKIFKSRF